MRAQDIKDAIEIIKSYPDTATTGTINVTSTVSVTSAITFNATGKTITVSGNGTLQRSSSLTSGDMISVSAGTVKFTNVTLDGKNVNAQGAILYVNGTNTEVTLDRGCIIQNGNNISELAALSRSGGVHLYGGTLNMNDGAIIQNNTATRGAGIYAQSNTSFNMNGGTIQGNQGSDDDGAVCTRGDFRMKGGTITKNCSGVAVYGSESSTANVFEMSAGTISDNTSMGVLLSVFNTSNSSPTFKMTGGTISGNKNYGVYFSTASNNNSIFTGNGTGIFSNNSPKDYSGTYSGTGGTSWTH